MLLTEGHDWKERVWQATKRAEETGVINMSALARKAGITQSGLAQWRKDKMLGDAKCRALARELEAVFTINIHAGGRQDMDIIECANCGNRVPRFADQLRLYYCGVCKAPLGLQCDDCGRMNEWDAHFCAGCGQPLTEEADIASNTARKAIVDAKKSKAERAQENQKKSRKRGEPEY